MTTPAGGDLAPSGSDDGRVGGGSLPSPLDSVDDMRAAAKWMLAAAGAVGAALISGGPLVAVGQVHGLWHAFLAWLGLVIALGGVGVAIWYTSQVLVPRLTTPNTMRKADELDRLRTVIASEPAEFMGFSAKSVDGLFKRQDLLREKTAALMLQVGQAANDEQRGQAQAALAQVQKNSQVVAVYVRWVLALGHAELVRVTLQRSRRATLAGGVIVAFGAVLFFSATGSSGPAQTSDVTTSPTATPAPTATATPLPAPTR